MIELFLTAIVLAFFPYRFIWLGLLVVVLIALPGIRARWGGAPYVRSSKKTQDVMFSFAEIKPANAVHDLGCGDGTVVRRAAKLGANAMGIEASLPTFLVAWLWCAPFRGAHIRFGDLWEGDYRNADVVFCYLLVDSMQRFEREIWPTLKPGCRVVSNSFRMKGLTPTKEGGSVFLYVKR